MTTTSPKPPKLTYVTDELVWQRDHARGTLERVTFRFGSIARRVATRRQLLWMIVTLEKELRYLLDVLDEHQRAAPQIVGYGLDSSLGPLDSEPPVR